MQGSMGASVASGGSVGWRTTSSHRLQRAEADVLEFREDRMEFLLSLREALSQLDEPPQPYAVEMFPSVFLIPLEQEALKRIICSRCGACAWEKVRQAALPRRPDISWPYNLPVQRK